VYKFATIHPDKENLGRLSSMQSYRFFRFRTTAEGSKCATKELHFYGEVRKVST
jgi:hypothetical protein